MDLMKAAVRSDLTANAVRLLVGLASIAVEGVTPATDWADVGRCAGMSRSSAHRAAVELQRDSWIERVSAVWALPQWRLRDG